MEKPSVEIKSLRAYGQHNIHAYMPVLEAVLDIGPYVNIPSSDIPGFEQGLVSALPGLRDHECSPGHPGGFLERLRRGTYLPHIVEHVCLELQNVIGFKVGFGRARPTKDGLYYRVLVEYREEAPARAAFQTALRMTLAFMQGEPLGAAGEIERLRDIADTFRPGPSTESILRAARRRGIPVLRLTRTENLVQLGYGIHQQHIRSTETSRTSSIAVSICQDKVLTKRMLKEVGIPVPDGRCAFSADQALDIAREIGAPVVIKPYSGHQGKGVTTGLVSEDEIRKAFDLAEEFGDALVEKHVEGSDYRLLVIDYKLVAAARRAPARISGDGRHTIRELIDRVNEDSRRTAGHGGELTRIEPDEGLMLELERQHDRLQTIPSEGQVVRLRSTANLSTGGTASDVTGEVCRQNARLAELAARVVGLDVAGVDIICEDIGRPLNEQHGAVVEINAAPGFRMHLYPSEGRPQPVGESVIEMLFPEGNPSSIPIITVTGTNGKTTVVRLISHIFKSARKTVGMTCTDGIYIDGVRIVSGDASGPRSARTVLMHPKVEVAVLEAARGGILRSGLGYDGCTVGVVTNISPDHIGMGGIETVEDLARVKRVVIEAVHRDGAAVLNADDLIVSAMAADTDARIIFFSADPRNPIVQSHLAEGGSCVCADEGRLILCTGKDRVRLIEFEMIPLAEGGKVAFEVTNVLAAVAAAWGAGVNPAYISHALATFRSDFETVPARFNIRMLSGVEVVADYGHNEAAMRELGRAIGALGARRTVMVLTLPGDRRDEDLIATLAATVPFVDEYVLTQDMQLRGRAYGEVPELLHSRLPSGKPARIINDYWEAVKQVWKTVRPGDRLIIIADKVDELIDHLQSISRSASEEMTCETPISDNGPEFGKDAVHREW